MSGGFFRCGETASRDPYNIRCLGSAPVPDARDLINGTVFGVVVERRIRRARDRWQLRIDGRRMHFSEVSASLRVAIGEL